MFIDFKAAREALGYSIDDVSKELKIRRQYVMALEEGDYSSIPGKVYADGYAKIYAEFLGIPKLQGSLSEINIEKIEQQTYTEKVGYPKYVLLLSVIMLIILFSVYDISTIEKIRYKY